MLAADVDVVAVRVVPEGRTLAGEPIGDGSVGSGIEAWLNARGLKLFVALASVVPGTRGSCQTFGRHDTPLPLAEEEDTPV